MRRSGDQTLWHVAKHKKRNIPSKQNVGRTYELQIMHMEEAFIQILITCCCIVNNRRDCDLCVVCASKNDGEDADI